MRIPVLAAVVPSMLFWATAAKVNAYDHSWCHGTFNMITGSCYTPPAIQPQPQHQNPPVATQLPPQPPPVKTEAPPKLTMPGGGTPPQRSPGTVVTQPQTVAPQVIVAPPLPGVVVTGPKPVPQPLPQVVQGTVAPTVTRPGGAVLPQVAPGGVVQQNQTTAPPQVIVAPPLPGVVVTGPKPVPQPLPQVVQGTVAPTVTQPGGAVLPQVAPGGVVQQNQTTAPPQVIVAPPLPGMVVTGPKPVPQPLPQVVQGGVAPTVTQPGGAVLPQVAPGAVVQQNQTTAPPQVIVAPPLPGVVVTGPKPVPQPLPQVVQGTVAPTVTQPGGAVLPQVAPGGVVQQNQTTAPPQVIVAPPLPGMVVTGPKPVPQPLPQVVQGGVAPTVTQPGGAVLPQVAPGAVVQQNQTTAPPQVIVAPPLPGVVVTGPKPVPQPLPQVVQGTVAPAVTQPGGAVLPQVAPGGVVQLNQTSRPPMAQGGITPPVMTPGGGSAPQHGLGTVVHQTTPTVAPVVEGVAMRPAMTPGGDVTLLIKPQQELGATEGLALHQHVASEPPLSARLITRLPGRQALHAQPQFDPGPAAGTLNCIASGHARRLYVDENGVQRVAGELPGFVVMTIAFHDIPASHPEHAECLIAVRRRDAGQAVVLPRLH